MGQFRTIIIIHRYLSKTRKNYSIITPNKSLYLNSLTVMLNILGLIPDVKPLLFNEKELLLKWREARKNKDFALADEIRQKITE